MSWNEVKAEMVGEKGLEESVADRIGRFVQLNGSADLVDRLLTQELATNTKAKSGLKAIKLLLKYCDIFKLTDNIRFDMSLARGLDYYTGVIFETELAGEGVECGSIAAGGRYDDLVSRLADKPRWRVPCVGFSIGVDRILAVMEKQWEDNNYCPTQVMVASIGEEMTEERMKVMVELWEAGIRAEHLFKNNPQIVRQLKDCKRKGIPFVVIIGENELNRGVVKLQSVSTRHEVNDSLVCIFNYSVF